MHIVVSRVMRLHRGRIFPLQGALDVCAKKCATCLDKYFVGKISVYTKLHLALGLYTSDFVSLWRFLGIDYWRI